MKKVKALKKGSKVAIVSPSWGGPGYFPHIYEEGLRNLRELMEWEPVEYPTARMDGELLYENPQLRAEDINRAFADPEIDGVLASIGGSDSIRILPYLDEETILANPKILMGYSDTTTLLTYLNYQGLVTFHGPSIMAGWSQIRNFPFVIQEYKQCLSQGFGDSWTPYPQWSENYVPWSQEGSQGKVEEIFPNPEGYLWLQGGQRVQSPLWGGCMGVLQFMIGTPFWPDLEFFKGRILLLETSEVKPSPMAVGWFLRNLGMQGILQELDGIFLGRPKDYNREEKAELYDMVLQIVKGEFSLDKLIIVANMDFGHTDPNRILPLGVPLSVDPVTRDIVFTESPFGGRGPHGS